MARVVFVWPIGERLAIQQTVKAFSHGIADLRPIWDSSDSKESIAEVVRQRAKASWTHQESPFGEKWAPLSPAYARRKGLSGGTKKVKGSLASIFRGVLVLSGALKRAATQKGAAGAVLQISPQSMVIGVNLGSVYPSVHQRTTRVRKDGVPIRRTWYGLRSPIDFLYITAKVEAYLRRLKGIATAVGGWKKK